MPFFISCDSNSVSPQIQDLDNILNLYFADDMLLFIQAIYILQIIHYYYSFKIIEVLVSN